MTPVEILKSVGWEDLSLCTSEAALRAMKAHIVTQGGFRGHDAERLTQNLIDRLNSRDDVARRDALFSFMTFYDPKKSQVRLIGEKPRASLFAEPAADAHQDLYLCFDSIPLCHVRVFQTEEDMREGFAVFSNWRHRGDRDVFGFIQLRVFTCGTETLYFSSDRDLRKETAYVWTDSENTIQSDFEDFAAAFLRPGFLLDFLKNSMLVRRHHTDEDDLDKIIALRPYQHHAARLIFDKIRGYIQDAKKGAPPPKGYIWHSTGSGKTITMIAAAMRILNDAPAFEKVVIVVDRIDLDVQTVKVLSGFIGDVRPISDHKKLQKTLTKNPRSAPLSQRIVITTIGKMATTSRNSLKNRKFVFLFDECHRSQDGKNNTDIRAAFPQSPVFGMTGTPIHLAGVRPGKQTTDAIFGDCLHRYLIGHACRDSNILPFNPVYKTALTNGVEARIAFDDPDHIRKIAEDIVVSNDTFTDNRKYASIVTFGSVAAVGTFYDAVKSEIAKRGSGIRVALSVSSSYNRRDEVGLDKREMSPAEEIGINGEGDIPPSQIGTDTGEDILMSETSRDLMERVVSDYADERNLEADDRAALKTGAYREYRRRIARDIQTDGDGAVDMLLVVGQFITGFDAPRVNTVYVMRDIKMHTLIQTISRANRTFGPDKTHGNAVFFSEAKGDVEAALLAYNAEDMTDLNRFILRAPYEDLVTSINGALEAIREYQEVNPEDAVQSEALREHLRACSAGLSIFPTYPTRKESDLLLSPKEAKALIAQARAWIGEVRPDVDGATPIIDDIRTADADLLEGFFIGNGEVVVSLADYKRQLEDIRFLPDLGEAEAQRRIQQHIQALSPAMPPRTVSPQHVELNRVKEMFLEKIAQVKGEVCDYYAARYGICPNAMRTVITLIPESGIADRKVMSTAGFEITEAFFRTQHAVHKIVARVKEMFLV